MYVRPQIEGEPLDFGISGKLWRDSLVMFDRETESLWSQLLGKAVAGPLEGRALEEIPSEVTTWGEWKARHPDTLALSKPADERLQDIRRRASSYADYHRNPDAIGVSGTENPDPRLPGKTLVFGLRRGQNAAAVPFGLLERHPVLNAEAFGEPVVVFSPPGEMAAMAYLRQVDDEVLRFEHVQSEEERLVARDVRTGSTWAWETGECLQGAFEGKRLERLPGLIAYWGIWAQFHPSSQVVKEPSGGG